MKNEMESGEFPSPMRLNVGRNAFGSQSGWQLC